MLLSFDVDAEVHAEHDRWHTQEHLPERLSIPGFLRGTRWVAIEGEPRYMVLYEVVDLSALESAPYLDRLNNPTPWTSKIMPHYRGMRRGLCSVIGSFGYGLGWVAGLIRFDSAPEQSEALYRWLVEEALPDLPKKSGIGTVHLLEGALASAMTNEQRIRGADGGFDSALVVTGYDRDAVADVAETTLSGSSLVRQGATEVVHSVFRLDYSLTNNELDV